MTNSPSGFSELACKYKRGVDFDIEIIERSISDIVIIAPHGGKIERRTSDIARAIAGDDFNLYLFEGIRSELNYETLHLTSHLFDEPECLSLIKNKKTIVAIHGCNAKSEDEYGCVFLGGQDLQLKGKIADSLQKQNIKLKVDNHRFPGQHPENICNRGLTGKGIQIELTDELRGTDEEPAIINAVRSVLLKSQLRKIDFH
ncbi:MAG: poly-gamma-glutamate hydrolase family protein [Gammaproteobacteria bacterium]